MRYHEYLAKGWPIAGGPVEGACKHLIKDRMERSGMRWTEQMAEAIVQLRAVYLSGDFDQRWQFHIDEDQKRLYPAACMAGAVRFNKGVYVQVNLRWALGLIVSCALYPGKAPAQQPPTAPANPASPEPRLWVMKTLVRPEVPGGRTQKTNPIDAFIAAEYKSRGLVPVGPADKRTLLRRVYLDLVGIPPTTEEQSAFLAEESPDAYEKIALIGSACFTLSGGLAAH
jgi:hypothetical protein